MLTIYLNYILDVRIVGDWNIVPLLNSHLPTYWSVIPELSKQLSELALASFRRTLVENPWRIRVQGYQNRRQLAKRKSEPENSVFTPKSNWQRTKGSAKTIIASVWPRTCPRKKENQIRSHCRKFWPKSWTWAMSCVTSVSESSLSPSRFPVSIACAR